MNIFKLMLLVNIIRNKSIGHITIFNKYKRYRLTLGYMFRLVCFVFRINKKPNYVNNSTPLTKSGVRKYEDGISNYIIRIVKTISQWSYLSRYDHETVVCEYYDTNTKKGGFILHPMIPNCRLAYALRTIHLSETNDIFIDSYCKILDGIDKMLVNSDDVVKITRWPLSNNYDYEPNELQNILCSMLLLISGFGNCYSDIAENLEESILSRYLKMYNSNDHCFYNYKNMLSHDISLNIMTNITNYYIYFISRVLDGSVNGNDVNILYSYIRVTPHDIHLYREIDVVLTLGLLEAIINICVSSRYSKILNMDVVNTIASLGVVQVDYVLSNRLVYNPEIESIKYVLQSVISEYDVVVHIVRNILDVINVMYVNDITRKTNSCRLDRVNLLKRYNKFNPTAEVSPGYRYNVPDYWIYSIDESCECVDRDYPAFDYVIVYAKLNAILHTTI